MGFPDWEKLTHDVGNGPGFVIELVAFVFCFLGLAIVCDDHLVKALEVLCVRSKIREDVAGATIMAFGSAAPEIIINAVATIKTLTSKDEGGGSSDMGVGAIIGSGLIAFLAIPGVCGVFAQNPLEIKRRPLLRDITFYSICLLSVCFAFADGLITTAEAALLLGIYVVFVVTVVFSRSVRIQYQTEVLGLKQRPQRNFVEEQMLSEEATRMVHARRMRLTASAALELNEGDTRTAGEQCGDAVGCGVSVISAPLVFLFDWTCPACGEGEPFERFYLVTFLIAFCWVALFSYIISGIVEAWALQSGVSMSYFGVVLVALGAEIPDMIQSVTVSRRGYGSMAVSNCLGSQITNISVGLGLPWTIAAAAGKPVTLKNTKELMKPALFMVGAVTFHLCLTLLWAVVRGEKKAILDSRKGLVFITAYGVALAAYTVVQFAG